MECRQSTLPIGFKRQIFALALLLAMATPKNSAAQVDTCLLQLPFPTFGKIVIFVDTVWIDTCSSVLPSYDLVHADLYDSAVSNHLYRRRHYFIEFFTVPIQAAPFDEDSVHLFQVSDIDTSLTEVIALLEHMDTAIGSFGLKRYWQSDSLEKEFEIVFDDPARSIDVQNLLLTDTNILYRGGIPYAVLLSVPSDPAFRPLDLTSAFQTSNAEVRDRTFHLLGYQWQMFRQKLPMAWEITKGRNDI